jgi:hypothetical protein
MVTNEVEKIVVLAMYHCRDIHMSLSRTTTDL